MDRYLEFVLGRPLSQTERGDIMDAYRRIALRYGVEESTPRMWRSRGAIPKHIYRQIVAEMDGRDPETAVEALDFSPAVTTVARDVQRIYDLTGGKGDVWRSLTAAIELAKTWARRGSPVSLRHLRPLGR